MKFFPYGGFKCLKDSTIESKFSDLPKDSDVGFLIEVVLEYPKELHDLHKDFCSPLSTEQRQGRNR